MPDSPGDWRCELVLRAGKESYTTAGTVTAVVSQHPGPVSIDPQHPFHFIRTGTGEHWFWNSTTTYYLLAHDEPAINAALERLQSLGINRIRVALAARTSGGDRWKEPLVKRTEAFPMRVEPWIAARPDNIADPGYDVQQFNLKLFQKIDHLLAEAARREIFVSLIFYLDGSDQGVVPFDKSTAGGADELRYYDYVLARCGASWNVMWDITNEWHLFRDEAWVNKLGAHVNNRDPYHRVTSVHGSNAFPFRKESWADVAFFQSWDEHGGYDFMLANRERQLATGRPLPQVNEEYGYEDHYPIPWGEQRVWPARIADSRRRLAWEISMAGAYQSTGERANSGVGAGPDTGGGWISGRGDDSMTMLLGYQRMKAFFTSLPWWELEPRRDLAGPGTLVLAQTHERYVAYAPAGGPLSLRIAAGIYRCRWYNPRTGDWSKSLPVTAENEQVWKSPMPTDRGDWALVLERGADNSRWWSIITKASSFTLGGSLSSNQSMRIDLAEAATAIPAKR